jgi:hypothetical protein
VFIGACIIYTYIWYSGIKGKTKNINTVRIIPKLNRNNVEIFLDWYRHFNKKKKEKKKKKKKKKKSGGAKLLL